MTRDVILAIDAGKSGCRAAAYRDGKRIAQSSGPGFANIAAPDGPTSIRAALETTLAGLPESGRYTTTCLGLTGVLKPDAHASTVARLLGEVVATDRAIVTSDVVTTFCGALGTRPGVVVAAGTGTIVLGIGPDGTSARVDGWGYLLDDAGSGFEIGRAGLREALRVDDGRGGSLPLHDAALEVYGSIEAILDTVYGAENPARTIAAFALQVADVALAGDPVARRLLSGAAGRLAASALAAATRTFPSDAPVPLSWNGGVFRSEKFVLAPFLDRVTEQRASIQAVPPHGDALDGAASLARTTDPSAPVEHRFAGDLLTIVDQLR